MLDRCPERFCIVDRPDDSLGPSSRDETFRVLVKIDPAPWRSEVARFAARLARVVVHHERLAIRGHSGNERFIRTVDGTHRLAVVACRMASRTHHPDLP